MSLAHHDSAKLFLRGPPCGHARRPAKGSAAVYTNISAAEHLATTCMCRDGQQSCQTASINPARPASRPLPVAMCLHSAAEAYWPLLQAALVSKAKSCVQIAAASNRARATQNRAAWSLMVSKNDGAPTSSSALILLTASPGTVIGSFGWSSRCMNVYIHVLEVLLGAHGDRRAASAFAPIEQFARHGWQGPIAGADYAVRGVCEGGLLSLILLREERQEKIVAQPSGGTARCLPPSLHGQSQ